MNENKEKMFYEFINNNNNNNNKICTIWIFHLTLEASIKSVGYGFAKTTEDTCANYHTAPSSGHVCLYRPNFYKNDI